MDAMDGMLVFDQQNDIVFTQLNAKMKQKLFDMAKQQELVAEDAVSRIDCTRSFRICERTECPFQTEDKYLDSNVIVQLFSPLIASQRIMFCQFDNSYTSLQLDGNLNLVFEEVGPGLRYNIDFIYHISQSASLFDSSWDSSS